MKIRLVLALYLALCGVANAQLAGGLQFPGPGTAHTTAAAATSWNSGDQNAGILLSNSNLTAALNTGAGNFEGVRAVASHSSGQYYYEVNVAATNGLVLVGIAQATAPLNDFFGNNANSVGWLSNDHVYQNGSFVSVNNWVAGNTLCLAVDLTTHKIWLRVGSGNWNNDVIGNQNPAVGSQVGGITIPSGTFFPGATVHDTSDALTASFGPTYAQTKPAGYSDW